MTCDGCLNDAEVVCEIDAETRFKFCKNCCVTYAKGRRDWTFSLDEEVMIKNWHKKSDNEVFVIKGIFILEECQSGRMIHLVHRDTNRPFKGLLDTNWLLKL